MAGYSSKFDEWVRRPDTKAKLALAKKKMRGHNSQNSFQTRTKINSMFKQALMKTLK